MVEPPFGGYVACVRITSPALEFVYLALIHESSDKFFT